MAKTPQGFRDEKLYSRGHTFDLNWLCVSSEEEKDDVAADDDGTINGYYTGMQGN